MAAGLSAPHAANLWSVAGAVVALVFLYALSLRLAGRDPSLMPATRVDGELSPPRAIAALLPPALLALNPAWIIVTTQAEVYSWHVAWALGAAFVFAGALPHLSSEGADRGPQWPIVRTVVLWGFLGGLGLAHHATSLLSFLPLTLVLFAAWWRSGGPGGARPAVTARPTHIARLTHIARPTHIARLTLLGAGAFVIPLLAYFFLLWRASHPAPVHWPELEPGFGSFWRHVTGSGYGAFLGRFAPSAGERLLLERSVYPFLVAGGLALVAAFFYGPWRGRRLLLGALLVVVALQVVAAFQYGVFDVSSYFLAPLALGLAGLAPIVALAAGSLARRLGEGRSLSRSPGESGSLARRPAEGGSLARHPGERSGEKGLAPAVLAGFIVLGAAGWLQPGWYGQAIERREHLLRWDRTAREIWRSLPDRPSIFLWAADAYMRFIEYQVLERPPGGRDKSEIYVGNPLTLVTGPGRRDFERRFGIDPMDGLDPPPAPTGSPVDDERMARFERALAASINKRVEVPVVYFDFRRGKVTELRKER